MHDTIIRGGKVIDGTGAPAFTADVAIEDGRIVEVGRVQGQARREIDADGAIVTPGFVDVHTHYDGQVLWDDQLDPSFSHGVTTAIGGNCGVGFAPLTPDTRQRLIEFMEGVEEIPEAVLEAGLDWRWTSFGEYLARIDERRYAMDVASHVAHAPIRLAVMGDRAMRHEPATAEDIAGMQALVREAMDAGAVGFSGGRVLEHHSSRGDYVPGTFAGDEEMLALAKAMGEGGHGVFQMNPRGANGALMFPALSDRERHVEHDFVTRLAEASGRPVTYVLLQFAANPDDWRAMLAQSEAAVAAGHKVYPQISTRGVGSITTLDGHHIFLLRPAYHEVAHLPLAQRLVALRDPARRAAILAQSSDPSLAPDPQFAAFLEMLRPRVGNVFPMTAELDYEPGPERRLSALAAAAGVPVEAYLYDHYTADQGTNLCASFMLNYARGNYDAIHDMLAHPLAISGLGDGGAHMKMACDSGLPTFQLSFWARDRKRGPTLPLEHIVGKLSRQNAELYGLTDRGVLAPGMRADVNVIDFERVKLTLPRMTRDLPAGGGRLIQGSSGYLATLVAGEVTRERDADTGARPGRLVRSGRLTL